MKKSYIYIGISILIAFILCILIALILPYNASHNVLEETDTHEHLFQTCDTPYYWWQEWFFTDSLHYKYVNEIYYADTYEEYFAMLDEFYPIELPENATEYDKYKASVIQFDSLMSFPGDEGATVQIYLYESYNQTFTYYTQQKITDLLKNRNLYSVEVDSAWNKYLTAMEKVVDTVVMYRPQCLGTISQMEFVSFMGYLKDSYLNSLLEILFYPEMDVPKHMTLTDDIINSAYDTLRAHQTVPDIEYEDLRECTPPVATRIDAINQDQVAWQDFMKARAHFEHTLHGAKRKAYRNATNNLMWSKLWLLKQEYHNFKISGSSFQELLLPLNSTDEEVLNYDFKKICSENGYSNI
ncbi:MAG: hypothetical protein IKW35_01130 [Paludibacteraceae bacterium]|nr:hypothetical protein [Paludibacteraceae bacterium]